MCPLARQSATRSAEISAFDMPGVYARSITSPPPVRAADTQFRRNYNHTWAGEARGIGNGFRHSFDQWLAFNVDGLTYINAERREARLPFLDHDGERATSGGYTLVRKHAGEYRVSRHAQPTRAFRPGTESPRYWPLTELEKDGETLRSG